MTSLLAKALDMFDSLLVRGRLFYEPTTGEVVEDQGFKVHDMSHLFLGDETIPADNLAI